MTAGASGPSDPIVPTLRRARHIRPNLPKRRPLKKVGAEPRLAPPAELSAIIAKDWNSYGEAIRIANVKVE